LLYPQKYSSVIRNVYILRQERGNNHDE
jgi:hypothetical protein